MFWYDHKGEKELVNVGKKLIYFLFLPRWTLVCVHQLELMNRSGATIKTFLLTFSFKDKSKGKNGGGTENERGNKTNKQNEELEKWKYLYDRVGVMALLQHRNGFLLNFLSRVIAEPKFISRYFTQRGERNKRDPANGIPNISYQCVIVCLLLSLVYLYTHTYVPAVQYYVQCT